MTISYFIKGLIIGLSLAIPLGPIGLLVIRRTLTHGRMAGLVSGMGAATADAFYGAVAGFGLTLVSSFLISHSLALRLTGGVFLCYLGARIFISRPKEKTTIAIERNFMGNYASTLVLTLTNPLTIISFAALFAAAGTVGVSPHPQLMSGALVLGVFTGSSLWWAILSGLVSLFHGKLNATGLLILNKISGAMIAAFGLMIVVSLQIWR
ncbi:MAG: LysE family transporter [Pseudomonadota bacterium]